MGTLTIGKLAAAAAVGIDTVRFYERVGLLRPAQRSASGYRHFAATDLARLRFIRRAKQLGFSLEEIGDLLALNDGNGSRASIRALAKKRLAQIERELAELTAVKTTLQALVQRCDGTGAAKGCPIVQAVLDASPATRRNRPRSATP